MVAYTSSQNLTERKTGKMCEWDGREPDMRGEETGERDRVSWY